MATTTTASALIKDVYAEDFIEGVYRNNDLLKLFPDVEATQGDTAYKWLVNSAGGTSAVYSEGDSALAATSQTWVAASVSPTYIWHRISISGHLKDAIRSNHINAIEQEMVLAKEDMKDLLNTSFMGSTYGLELSIDSGSTYAGIARGAAAYWESTETAVGGALAYTDLVDMLETIRDNDKGGNPGMILAPYNQLTNIYNLTGNPATKMAGPGDLAQGFNNQTFAGIPIFGVGDMTDTVILFVDTRAGKNKLVIHRPFQVDQLGKTSDADDYLLSTAAALVNRDPAKDGKLTGVTA